ncbi:MAG TPA: isocitrate lyase/phosphoenolpyruvate mutase family protein [Streptosporangiaceae bacterium]|nr:isocitrate lyase/phosphoenolpyruvate mutase family protein [Streptosporangiaceae bacterium]
MTSQTDQAARFAALHKPGDPLLLPNAWDPASAAIIAAAGARAIATTSAGVAWSFGIPDAADLGAARAAEAVARIRAVTDLPVSADIEAGYDDVAATVAAVVAAGAVGLNIEDRQHGVMLDAGAQADRLAAARAAAGDVPIWINARTDVFLGGSADVGEVRERAAAYASAGADSVFVPGLADPAAITGLVAACPIPVAVMVWPGAPSVADLAAAGVARISLGSAIAQAAYAAADRAARELLTAGTYTAVAHGVPYHTLNALFS